MNLFGVTSHLDTNFLGDALMGGGGNGTGLRAYPSVADILAVAQLSGFTDLNLDPTPVPLPAAAPLLIGGLLTVAGFSRRRRRQG